MFTAAVFSGVSVVNYFLEFVFLVLIWGKALWYIKTVGWEPMRTLQ